MDKILICYGTRPEYIKIKSLIDNIPGLRTLFTGQHEDLINLKNIKPEYLMKIDETISSNRLNNIMGNILKYSEPFDNTNLVDWVLIQGDTTSALSIALSAFNHGKKIIHLEAGLRSHDLTNPFPEEANRQLISRLAHIHLCPTQINKLNLEREQIHGQIHVVGNTGLDQIDRTNNEYTDLVIITLHRRDNINLISEWFGVLESIALKYSQIKFIYISHPNPEITKYINIFSRVKVVEPMNHFDMIELIKKSKFVISDSGGIQEECSYLKKKIIICRKNTERVEVIEQNDIGILCPNPENLPLIVDNFIDNYVVDISYKCPYGDGTSWMKIKKIFEEL
jgi:UDP-N-acetylglucosamine 2-epimerase (non-hydrolysing)